MRGSAVLGTFLSVLLIVSPVGAMNKWGLSYPGDPGPEIGCQFPDFPLPDTSGKMVWFNDFRGKPLIVSFCSCYTDTCCALMNTLERIRSRHGENLMTIVVCCETAPALVERSYEKLLFECRDAADVVLIDELEETIVPFRIETLPTSYMIDGDFCVRHRALDVTDLNAPAFREDLKQMLDEFPQLP